MLHELLLILSAHESSIFKAHPSPPSAPETLILDPTFTDIHPSERVALNDLAHLSFLHRSLRETVSNNIQSHKSIVLRAILSRIQGKTQEFQGVIEGIEKLILTRDDSVVAFDIVPLARLSTLLGEWQRILEWLHKFVLSIKIESTGAEFLTRLQKDQHTGYPDIAEIVVQLIKAGEEAWIRQVSSWVLYGRIPQLGFSDFFIHPSKNPNISALHENAFIIEWDLWPEYLPRETASSILFIGRALARIQMQSPSSQTSQQILKSHVQYLNTVTFPLVQTTLSKAITSIRLSLSSSILSTLLPLETIIHLVHKFRQDFLLGHGSLMITLLSVTEDYLQRRQSMDGGTIKEAEVNNILSKSSSIVSRLENLDDESPEYQAYQSSLKLSLLNTPEPTKLPQTAKSKVEQVTFDSFLVGERIQLKYEITWPLDLFLSTEDIIVYNRCFMFLLAVKRCQKRLTSVWPGRRFQNVRRTTWTTVSYALFFIDSLWSYFQATLIEPSFSELLAQLSKPSLTDSESTGYDPEMLRASHTAFLVSLQEGLFLSPSLSGLLRLLKQLLVQVDAIVDIIWRDEDVDSVRLRGVRAVVDECVRELEGVGERDGRGGVEKLLLALDGGQWFSNNFSGNGEGRED